MQHLAPIIEFSLFGYPFRLDLSALLMIVVTSAIVFVLCRLAVRNLSVTNPGKLQNFMEWVVDFVRNIVGGVMEESRGRRFVSLGLTLILFIFVANLLGLPFSVIIDYHHATSIFGFDITSISHYLQTHEAAHVLWWKSPTADASITLGLAFMVVIMAQILGMVHSPKHYFKHFFEPNFAFLPINLMKLVSKPLTLGLRLFGNIYAGEVLITVLLGAGIFGIPGLIVWQGFSLFVGGLQAFIFTMLSMVYISQELHFSENDAEH
ncbi:F0F1 ATP synthase subunit A [Paenibacillus sp. TRM 82003]|nr:F0F1 ATP synthase subunit A [Paenibacillus sp. TRM 82003]MCI3923471.1 F0F1 ATP synthase subunit A [Paenibacillus sp. TRM 82003]